MQDRIAFVGPSLDRRTRDAFAKSPIASTIKLVGPAQFGDIAAAANSGFSVIVLIDGVFGEVAPPRHKEILDALSRDLTVGGAASLGALRACECAAFGMVGIGPIFEAYRDGELVADDAVATLHGPEELGHCALTDPLVTIEANTKLLRSRALISNWEFNEIMDAARQVHFSQRHLARMIRDCFSTDQARIELLLGELKAGWVDPKADDAIEALRYAASLPAEKVRVDRSWVMADSHYAVEFMPNAMTGE